MTEMGFLGPPGTFTEEVALAYNDSNLALREYPTIDCIMEDVASGVIEQGMVPLENSLEGSVSITLDMLSSTKGLYIRKEIIHPISHTLLTLGNTPLEDIIEVYSHYQAFAQCREFLRNNLGCAALIPVESTAAAAARVAEKGGLRAAIAPLRAAGMFNLYIQDRDIQDSEGSVTRFVILAREDASAATGCDKTSMVISIKDGPGSLYDVLGIFTRHAINLTRIESRPARRNLGEYLFFVDFQGHRTDSTIKKLISELQSSVEILKMLGSYPEGNRDK